MPWCAIYHHYHWSSASLSSVPWGQEITKPICELRKRWIHSSRNNLQATSSEPGTWSGKSHRVKNPGGGFTEIDSPRVACLTNRPGHGVKAAKPISRSPGGKGGPLTGMRHWCELSWRRWSFFDNFARATHDPICGAPIVVSGKAPFVTPFYGCMGYKLELALHRKLWKNIKKLSSMNPSYWEWSGMKWNEVGSWELIHLDLSDPTQTYPCAPSSSCPAPELCQGIQWCYRFDSALRSMGTAELWKIKGAQKNHWIIIDLTYYIVTCHVDISIVSWISRYSGLKWLWKGKLCLAVL